MEKFYDEPRMVGDSYLVDPKTGRIITMRDTLETANRAQLVQQEYIDDYIVAGYVTNWEVIRIKIRNHEFDRKQSEKQEQPHQETFRERVEKEAANTANGEKQTAGGEEERTTWNKYTWDYRTSGEYHNPDPEDDSSWRVIYERDSQGEDQRREETKYMGYEGKHDASKMNDATADGIRRAKQTSYTEKKHAAQRNRQRTEKVKPEILKNWKKYVAGILAIIVLEGAVIGADLGIRSMVTNHRTSNTSTNIATLLVPEGAKNKPTILERNTHRTTDFQGFWYDNENIAEEILEIPDGMFEATLYTVFDEMGDYRDTGYIDNFSRVIKCIAEEFEITKEDGKTVTVEEIQAAIAAHPIAYAMCGGCQDEEDFLVKNHYTTKDGIASEDEYVKHGKSVIREQYNYIKQAANQYDPNWVDKIEQPVETEEIDDLGEEVLGETYTEGEEGRGR